MAKEFKISALRLKELEQELFYLKTTREKEVAEQIKEARSFGDLSENSEYDEAKNEQTKVVTRIQDIEELLLHAEVINETEVDTNVVHLGSTVKLLDIGFGEEIEYSIVGTNEVDALNGKISDQSPIGSALLGAKKGETVTVETPNGDLKFKVLDVWRVKNN